MIIESDDKSNKIDVTPFSYFALRVPAYSIDTYLNKEHSDFLDIFEKDLDFQEAIFWASPSLYDSIIHKSSKDLKDRNIVNTSLKNYYKRMSSRATPFGTFSGFTIGKFSNKTNLNNTYKFVKKYRISYVWLSCIIDKIESEYEIIKFLNVKFNKNAYKKNNRLYLYDSIDLNSITSIEYTEQINYIFEFSKNPINVEDLIIKITNIYGIEFKDRIINLILGLIKNRYIISELRVENLELDTIIGFLKKSTFYNEYIEDLIFIDLSLKKLNIDQKFNKSLATKLIERMKKVNESTDYIQVDTKIENINISIDSKIAKSVCEAYQWMWNVFGSYKEYIEEKELFLSKFIDKYGENIKVPINHLYMNSLGLEDLIYKFKEDNNLNINLINTILLKKITDCMLNKGKEINLDDIELNINLSNTEGIPIDLEIYSRIIFSDINNKNNYTFIVNNSNYGDSIGASFGRFSDFIDDNNFFIELNKVYNDNNNIEPLQIFHESHNYKLQNVMRNSEILNKSIKLNLYDDLDSIDINDISIVAQNNKLFLWSDKLNKQITLTKLHMVNYAYLPKIYQILLIIDKFNEISPDISIFRNLTKYSYSPRIKFKNIILKPMTWTIYSYFINDLNEINWISYFNEFRKTNKLDKYVNLLKTDNKLLINTEDSEDIKFLFTILKKNKRLILEEIYGLNNYQLIEDENNRYLSEVIIPIISNTNTVNTIKVFPKEMSTHKYYSIGDDYIYIKLYVNIDTMDLVLTEYLYPFIKSLIKESYIDEMFFIRYHESNSHLRIRLYGNNKNLLTIIPMINNFFDMLNKFSLSTDISFNLYNPEIIRYGGEAYFRVVEKYFYYESIFVMEILSKIKNKIISIPIESILVASLINMFKSMKLSYEECCEFININDKSKKDIIKYRDYRNDIIGIIKNESQNLKNGIQEINKLIYEKDSKSELKKLKEIKNKNYLYSIINSLIHMSCNRFNFSDILFEIRVRELLRSCIRDFKYWSDLIYEQN